MLPTVKETLGGYDIFVTRYDSEDNTYLKPSNIGMPFNSTANDYLYVVDEFNNLGWFATDRDQPTDTVCVYVFIPNESKQSYNYEASDPKFIMDVATLHSIRSTWQDEDQVREARQRLATLKYASEKEIQKTDFKLVIDDNATYTLWSDFRSNEARESYRQLVQKEKDLAHFQQTLQQKRSEYESENGLGKKKLEPSILDMEKRILQLKEEIDQLYKTTRNLEIQKFKQ